MTLIETKSNMRMYQTYYSYDDRLWSSKTKRGWGMLRWAMLPIGFNKFEYWQNLLISAKRYSTGVWKGVCVCGGGAKLIRNLEIFVKMTRKKQNNILHVIRRLICLSIPNCCLLFRKSLSDTQVSRLPRNLQASILSKRAVVPRRRV